MTVDIPDLLFRRAKIRAVEQGKTMRELVMASLESELAKGRLEESASPYFANRRVLDPEFARLHKTGAFRGGSDSTESLSTDRDAH